MKEIFDIHRFGALALKYYRENLKTILVFLGMMVVVTFMVVCQFNPFRVEYLGLTKDFTKEMYIESNKENFALFFWALLGFFSAIAAGFSFVDVMSRRRSDTALLLPASSFEKFLLVMINSTVIIFLIHLGIFYGTANIACSYKYAGLQEMDFTKSSVFGVPVPVLKPGQEIVRREVGNVFYFVDEISKPDHYVMRDEHGKDVKVEREAYITPFVGWNLLITAWLFWVGLFLWGAITFRKRSVILTILLHGLFFLLLGFTIYWIGDACFKRPREESMLYGLYFFSTDSVVTRPPALCLLLLYIFPITYIGVIWKKFKEKQV